MLLLHYNIATMIIGALHYYIGALHFYIGALHYYLIIATVITKKNNATPATPANAGVARSEEDTLSARAQSKNAAIVFNRLHHPPRLQSCV